MRILPLVIALLASPAAAQVSYPPSPTAVESQTVTLDSSGNATWTLALRSVAPPT